MPPLSSVLVISTHSLTLLALSALLLYDPAALFASPFVYLVGEAMRVRPLSLPGLGALGGPPLQTAAGVGAGAGAGSGGGATVGPQQFSRDVTAMLAVALAALAGTDWVLSVQLFLPSASSPSSKRSASAAASASSAAARAATRTTQSSWLVLAGLRVLASSALASYIYLFHSASSPVASPSSSSPLANGTTFTALLLETLFWGWTWTIIRDEGRPLLARATGDVGLNQDGTASYQ